MKFIKFYDQVDFGPEHRIAITKAIIELTDPSGSSGLTKTWPRGNNRFEDIAMVFCDYDCPDLPNHHNRSLYVTARIREVELKRGSAVFT